MPYSEDFLINLYHDYHALFVGVSEGNSFLLIQRVPRINSYIDLISRLIPSAIEDHQELLKIFKDHLQQLVREAAEVISKENNEEGTSYVNVDLSNINMSVETLLTLRRSGLPWAVIARHLSISRMTMYKIRKRLGIQEPNMYVNDQELELLLFDLLKDNPTSGAVTLRGALLSVGIQVAEGRIKNLLRSIDPVGVLMRRTQRIKRRCYKVKDAHYMAHLDGDHKIAMFLFIIHGCVDGYSRKILYLDCSTDNKAETVLSLFETSVEQFGLPERVRGDRGCENVAVERYINEAYGEQRFIHGPSVHNIRIERLWRDVNEKVASYYKDIFLLLESKSLLREDNLLDMFCLQYVFRPRIRMSLLNFKNAWNNHSMRTMRGRSPNQSWITGMLRRSVASGVNFDVSNFNFQESLIANHTVPSVFNELGEETVAIWFSICEHLVPDPMAEDHNCGIDHHTLLRKAIRQYYGLPEFDPDQVDE